MRNALLCLSVAALLAVLAGCADKLTAPMDYDTVRPCTDCHTDGVPEVPCADWDHDTPCE